MKKPLLNSLAQIRSEAEKNFVTKFESSKEAFTDAYANGEFHEHGTGGAWQFVGSQMSDEMIAYAVPSVLNPLVNHARGDDARIEQLMDFHEQMVKWLNHRLESTGARQNSSAKPQG